MYNFFAECSLKMRIFEYCDGNVEKLPVYDELEGFKRGYTAELY